MDEPYRESKEITLPRARDAARTFAAQTSRRPVNDEPLFEKEWGWMFILGGEAPFPAGPSAYLAVVRATGEVQWLSSMEALRLDEWTPRTPTPMPPQPPSPAALAYAREQRRKVLLFIAFVGVLFVAFAAIAWSQVR